MVHYFFVLIIILCVFCLASFIISVLDRWEYGVNLLVVFLIVVALAFFLENKCSKDSDYSWLCAEERN